MNTGIWAATLVGGVVVLVAVTGLLTALYFLVRGIDAAVDSLIEPGADVKSNTAKVNDLLTTAAVLNAIKEEALIHDDLLAKR
jgi:hypothetical protein